MNRCALLLPLLLVACSKSAGEVSAADTLKKIATADQNQIADMSRDLVRDVNALLRGVTDVDSAKSARPGFAELAKRVPPLRERRDELQAAAATAQDKLAFGQAYMSMLSEITEMGEEFARIEEVPGVLEELGQSMEGIMAFFEPSDR